MSFWNNADYAFQHNGQDSINEDIWARSAGIHKRGNFTPASLAAGCYGAQQAMMDPAVLGQTAAGVVLPWVPDVLGANWEDERAVHVVGWAYAGFIKEISSRDLAFRDYLKASEAHWHKFADVYLRHVIQGDCKYYEPLSQILEFFATKAGGRGMFSVFDLCRASLVKRGQIDKYGRRFDSVIALAGDDIKSQECVAEYCECSESQRWTWDRLGGSAATLVIVLGITAEHGLLMNLLQQEQKLYIWDAVSGKSWQPHANSASPLWTVNYAGSGPDWKPRLTIGERLKSPTWWCVGPQRGKARWHVIPIYHPSGAEGRFPKDPGYKTSIQYLDKVAALISSGRYFNGTQQQPS